MKFTKEEAEYLKDAAEKALKYECFRNKPIRFSALKKLAHIAKKILKEGNCITQVT